MQASWKLWAAAGLSAGLLELPFPLAGPMPPWRTVFAWFGLVPLLWAHPVARLRRRSGRASPAPRLFCSPISAASCGTSGNCYWVRDTMMHYGDMPPLAPTLLLHRDSAWCWGSTSASSAWASRWCAEPPAARGWRWPSAPFLWTALELAAARITSVPWDQLGYSQVDNALVNQLAPWTGVYGISFRSGRCQRADRRRFAAGASTQRAASQAAGRGRLAARFCSSAG